MSIWDKLKYFSPSENWGDPHKVDHRLLLFLDHYRHDLNVPLIVTSSVRYDNPYSAHFPNADGFAEAVDVIPLLSKRNVKLFDCFLLATKYPFTGIGVYPFWQIQGKTDLGGLHLDVCTRRLKLYHSSGHWVGLPQKRYVDLNSDVLRKYGII